MEPEKRQEDAKKVKFENFTYGLKKMLRYILIILVIGILISYLIHYFGDYNLSTVFKIVGGVIVFIGLASQLGTSKSTKNYRYDTVKMTNPDLLEYEKASAKMDENLIFLIIFAVAGLIILGFGFLF